MQPKHRYKAALVLGNVIETSVSIPPKASAASRGVLLFSYFLGKGGKAARKGNETERAAERNGGRETKYEGPKVGFW